MTEPATIGPHDASPHAGQVVRRVLLRRNIVAKDVPDGISAEDHAAGLDSSLTKLAAHSEQ